MSHPAARVGDLIKQDSPHCHMPHPKGPVVTPEPHPGLPMTLVSGCFTVLIGGQPAATVTSNSTPCTLPGCVPGGPGMVSMGSGTVLIGNMPAARINDMTAHPSCAAPIPAPVGKILPPGCPTVLIGG